MDNETFANDSQFAEAQIRVTGIDGAGGNAINRIITEKVQGVNSIVANTDLQALNNSQAITKICLGPRLTEGLGTGSNPEISEKVAQEGEEQVKKALEGADTVFITAGMGGGTGTGVAPTVAKLAKDSGALTVGVATCPFSFEGPRRARYAAEGLEKLKSNVDTLVIVANNRLLEVIGKKAPMMETFKGADNALRQGVQDISDLIATPGYTNLDFAGIKISMFDRGSALMGVGASIGESRATRAAKKTISSPLLEVSIDGAWHVLMGITGGKDLPMFGAQEASDAVKQAAGTNVGISFDMSLNESMGDEVRVTAIATGTGKKKKIQQQKPAERETLRVTRSIPQEEQPRRRGPFDGWSDPITSTSSRSRNPDSEFSHVTRPEFNVFNDDAANAGDNDDTNLPTPPFFKNRRK